MGGLQCADIEVIDDEDTADTISNMIYDAALSGDVDTIKNLANRVNIPKDVAKNAIQFAILNDKINAIEMLMACNGKIYTCDELVDYAHKHGSKKAIDVLSTLNECS